MKRFSPCDRRVDLAPIEPGNVLDGEPHTGWVELGGVPGAETGIWMHTPGTSTDIEENEIFVVLSGRATVNAEGEESVEFAGGDVGVLLEGAVTTWVVHETILKVYVTPVE